MRLYIIERDRGDGIEPQLSAAENEVLSVWKFLPAAASLWFQIWGVVDPGEKKSISPDKFPRNFDFFQAI